MSQAAKTIAAFFLLTSCSFVKDREVSTPVGVDVGAVEEKLALYCELSHPQYLDKGHLGDKCDSLLFTSLHGLACSGVIVDEFEKAPGEWKRSPTHDCYKNSESRTGISRDMLIGVTFYAWQHDRLKLLTRLIEYGEANNWYMCGGEYEDDYWRVGRCKVTSNLKATIYEVASHLGYACDDVCKRARAVPQVWSPYANGYEAHLVVLQILLRGLVQGSINGNQLSQLSYQAKRLPENALFTAAHVTFAGGSMAPSWEALQSSYFPSDRLPTSGDRCENYLWQRDRGKDWQPCKEDHTHSGTDFAIAAALILGQLKRGQP